MEKSLKESTQSYISKLNEFGLPYSFEIVERNSNGEFNHHGLEIYKDIPNVDKLILLTSSEHQETQGDIKFLVVETYKYPDPSGAFFGVPLYSYVKDDSNGQDISCYHLSDDTPKTFNTVYEALATCVSTFELDNLQKDMMVNIFREYDHQLQENTDIKDISLAQLTLAASLFNNYNKSGKDIFQSELISNINDEQQDKLIVSCKKYDTWTDIVYTGDSSILSGQVNSFLSENFSKYIGEVTDLSLKYCEMELDVKHKKNKSIPKL